LIHQGGSVAMDLELQGNRTVVQSLPLANRAALHLDQQDNSGDLHSTSHGDRATLQPVQSQPVGEGGVSSTSTHSACIPGKQSTMEIKVHRANIRNNMLTIFADPCILDECITLDVIFINRRGEEEAGRGSGLLRDLFSLFWKDVYQSLMVGEIERVPSIRHDFQ